MVVRFERTRRIGDPAHCEARACGGAHAGDNEIVEPPGLDGDLLELVAEHRQSDARTAKFSPIWGMTPMQGPRSAAASGFGGSGFFAAGLATRLGR